MRSILLASILFVWGLTAESLPAQNKESELQAEITRLKKEIEQLRNQLQARKGQGSDEEKSKEAATSCKTLKRASEAYTLRYGSPPSSLIDLITPPDGGARYIDPEAMIVDPWGRIYRYQVAEVGGNPEIYVWSVGPTPDGKSKVGSWPNPEPKKKPKSK